MGIPLDREIISLIATQVLDPDGSRALVFGQEGKTIRHVFSENMLHVHGFSSPEESSIEYSMSGDEAGVVFCRNLKPP